MLKSFIFIRIVFLTFCSLFVFSSLSMLMATEYNIIPYPQHLIPQSGKFTFNKHTVILCPAQNEEVHKLAQQFSDQLALVSGLKLVVTDIAQADTVDAVIFQPDNDPAANTEAYALSVSPKTIRIKASAGNGFFYALQSIYQFLPVEIYGKKKVSNKSWSVPAVQITDAPRFSYRGLHLDVCRHFFPIDFIKKYIDAMAIHKLNTFHWHLTDDQGWRIEIKKYPLLTTVGSIRDETLVGLNSSNYPPVYDGKPYGGFYTQDEAREIVAYAKARYITVIPEIEMPGHATAAVAAYPYLSCNRTPVKLITRWGIFKDVFCTRDSTFDFLQDVLTEIMDIFPSKYIHIGGDECPKDRWRVCPDCQALIKSQNLKNEDQLQSYFIHRIQKFLDAHGRRIIGWDEILDGGISTSATIMVWRGSRNGGVIGPRAGNQVIMTPGWACYFDKYQSDPLTEPVTIGGYLPLKYVYAFEPVPAALTPAESKFVLGAQANVWTEYMATAERVEYMAFPRVSALAEVLWSENTNRSWDRFRAYMPKEFDRYAAQNIHASKAYFDVLCYSAISKNRKVLITLDTDNPNSEIRYTTDGKTPTNGSKLYTAPFELSESSTVKAIPFVNGKKVSKELTKFFMVSKVTGLNYIQTPVNTWYRGDNLYSLTDGIPGNTKTYAQWVGIGSTQDGEIIIDMEKVQNISRCSVGLLSAPGLRVLYPAEVKVYTSMDGTAYTQVASETLKQRATGGWEIYRPEFNFAATDARFVKLVLLNGGPSLDLEEDGGKSFLFLDEIGVW